MTNSENSTFQIVLYYKKRVAKPSNITLESYIHSRREADDDVDFDQLLDDYKKMQEDGELVETWALVDDDDNFVENILRVEKSQDFVEWNADSKNKIYRKIAAQQ